MLSEVQPEIEFGSLFNFDHAEDGFFQRQRMRPYGLSGSGGYCALSIFPLSFRGLDRPANAASQGEASAFLCLVMERASEVLPDAPRYLSACITSLTPTPCRLESGYRNCIGIVPPLDQLVVGYRTTTIIVQRHIPIIWSETLLELVCSLKTSHIQCRSPPIIAMALKADKKDRIRYTSSSAPRRNKLKYTEQKEGKFRRLAEGKLVAFLPATYRRALRKMSMFNMPMLRELVEKAVSYQRSSQCVNVASAALFLADYLQTLELELEKVSLIWDRDWRMIKVLYGFSRYLPFAYLPVALFVGLQDNPTVSVGTITQGLSSKGVRLSIPEVQCKLCQQLPKALAIWLGLQFVVSALTVPSTPAVHAAIYAIFALFVRSTKFLPYQVGIPGCIPYRFDTTQLSVVFGIIVASETIIMLITVYLGVRRYRLSDSPLLVVFYQDGALYFLSLAGVTIGNIIFDLVGPAELRFMLAVPQGVLHSVLSCRMILHMYDFGRKEVMGGTLETGTALEFATVGHGRSANRSGDPDPHRKSSDDETV
ncbi:hypothetical protein NMY22_g3431 [Coprinellus aureogranulatus]|nr:hypothetical protein NMY22_g3431 [Coprinellus aureogranulatus]